MNCANCKMVLFVKFIKQVVLYIRLWLLKVLWFRCFYYELYNFVLKFIETCLRLWQNILTKILFKLFSFSQLNDNYLILTYNKICLEFCKNALALAIILPSKKTISFQIQFRTKIFINACQIKISKRNSRTFFFFNLICFIILMLSRKISSFFLFLLAKVEYFFIYLCLNVNMSLPVPLSVTKCS